MGKRRVCPSPPHTHSQVGTDYDSHRGGAEPSGKHTTICLRAPDLLTGSRPRGPTRQWTQNLGGKRFRSNFPPHTGTCTACPRTQGAAETAALKQPGLASAPHKPLWGLSRKSRLGSGTVRPAALQKLSNHTRCFPHSPCLLSARNQHHPTEHPRPLTGTRSPPDPIPTLPP